MSKSVKEELSFTEDSFEKKKLQNGSSWKQFVNNKDCGNAQCPESIKMGFIEKVVRLHQHWMKIGPDQKTGKILIRLSWDIKLDKLDKVKGPEHFGHYFGMHVYFYLLCTYICYIYTIYIFNSHWLKLCLHSSHPKRVRVTCWIGLWAWKRMRRPSSSAKMQPTDQISMELE